MEEGEEEEEKEEGMKESVVLVPEVSNCFIINGSLLFCASSSFSLFSSTLSSLFPWTLSKSVSFSSLFSPSWLLSSD